MNKKMERVVTVNHRRGSIIVPPRDCEVEVEAGGSIRLNIVPPVNPNAARTEEDTSRNPQSATWLNETTQDGRFIRINVPEGTPTCPYKYSIYIDDVGMLDPVIRVIR